MTRTHFTRTFIALLLISGSLAAQTPAARPDGPRTVTGPGDGLLTGRVVDAQSTQPIEYANIVMFRSQDSVMVGGGISGRDGVFTLEKLPYGRHYVRVSFIGYEPRIIDNVSLVPGRNEIALGEIRIENAAVNMGTVEVTGDRPAVLNNLDKRVFNVEKNIASSGGSALDVMENIPSVTVTADGNVVLRGSANVNVLIDGRPSGLAGVSSSDVLNQIPASSIEYVEVVTNPSVRYDPDGTAGIINIVMKKKSTGGMNGVAQVNAGNGDRYNGSLNLNYRTGIVNLFGSYDNRFNRFGGTSTTDRTSSYSTGDLLLAQRSTSSNRMQFHTFNAGIDIMPDPTNLVTFGAKYRTHEYNGSSASTDVTSPAGGDPLSRMLRSSGATRELDSYEYTLNWKKTWDPRVHELTADAYYTPNRMNRDDLTLQDVYDLVNGGDPYSTQRRTETANTNKMFTLQANYIRPIFGTVRLESGVKSQIKRLTMRNDYEMFDAPTALWRYEPLLSTDFEYDEDIHAAYAIASDVLFGIKYQLGLRAEYVVADPREASVTASYRRNYTSLYPSAHIVYPIDERNELQLSYSRRVERPGNRQLSPYVDVSDSLNIQQGNPYLNPEYIDSYELGHGYTAGRTALTTNLFFRRTNDLIERVTTLEPNNVTRSTWANIARSDSWGVEVTASQPLAGWWRMNASASYYHLAIAGSAGGQSFDASTYTWNAKLNSTMTVWWDLQYQILANYQAPSIEPQEREKAMYSVDMALRKEFFKGDLAFTLRVTDVFDTREWGNEIFGNRFYSNSLRKMDSRVAYFGVSWRINSEMRSRERERDRGPQSEGMDDF
jgi:outer membrane receptor protein involved in Fe transport